MRDVPGALVFAAGVLALVYAAKWVVVELLRWRPTAVYHINDAEGAILYVGRCYVVRTRMLKHRAKSWWYPDASPRFQHTLEPDTVRWFRNLELATQFETSEIRKLQPPGNTVHTLHRGRRRG